MTMFFMPVIIVIVLTLERFSVGYCQTKFKVITPTNYKRRKQRNICAKQTRSGIGFTCHGLRKWREFC